jgi:hypothetical protein
MNTPGRRRGLYNPLRKLRRRIPSPPPEPAIVMGRFEGRKLSELSDEELNSFLGWDAHCQRKTAMADLFSTGLYICQDLSQYWFAKYELERRKKSAERDPTSSIKLTAEDTNASIAMKLVNSSFRAASLKFHPDKGGDTWSMQRLNAAHDYARERLK